MRFLVKRIFKGVLPYFKDMQVGGIQELIFFVQLLSRSDDDTVVS
jgi:hypothetical protein